MLLESMGYSGAAAGIGQYVLASDRPSTGSDVNFFANHGHGISGDAALAAAISAPLHAQYLVPQPGDSSAVRFWKRAGTGLVYGVPMLVACPACEQRSPLCPDAFPESDRLHLRNSWWTGTRRAAPTASLSLLRKARRVDADVKPGPRSRLCYPTGRSCGQRLRGSSRRRSGSAAATRRFAASALRKGGR
jgi:hypothetical protein